MDVYQIIAWLGWVPNILIVEFIILKKYRYEKARYFRSFTLHVFVQKEAKITSLDTAKKDSTAAKPEKVMAPELHKELYGIWTGSFYPDIMRNPDDESGETKK